MVCSVSSCWECQQVPLAHSLFMSTVHAQAIGNSAPVEGGAVHADCEVDGAGRQQALAHGLQQDGQHRRHAPPADQGLVQVGELCVLVHPCTWDYKLSKP